MPPPSPPSASYLWKFDDLSDDSDDIEQLPKYSKGSSPDERRIEELSLSSPEDTLPPSHPLPSATKQPSSSTGVATLMPTAEWSVSPSGIGATATQDLFYSREGIIRLDQDTATDELNTTCEVQGNNDEDTATVALNTTCEVHDNNEEQSVSGDDTTVEDPHDASNATSASRKRKNRKKKKKKHLVNLITPLVNHRAVSFGFVSVRSFDRCLGGTVVPCDGGWPLGMDDRAYTEDTISVTDYETSKQERLLNRLQSIRQHLSKEASSSPTFSSKKESAFIAHDPSLIATPPDLPLETRQWDYKHKVKNPLFSSLSEHERMDLLLKASSVTSGTDRYHSSSPPKSTSPDSLTTSRKHVRHSPRGHHHQTNSTDVGPTFVAPSRTRSRSGSFAEQYNEVFTQVEVHHCRNELEQIRNFRTMEGSTGCSCRKLQVYLLPPNAGKKAHHRRMKLHKIKEELRKRHLLPPEGQQHSREELELLLHDTVEGEPCCRADSCTCARNGIECQADSCTCWYTSHQTKQTQHDEHTNHSTTTAGGNNNHHNNHSSSITSIITLDEIKARCGNSLGMSTVDMDKIDAFRRNYLSNLSIVSPETTPTTSNSSSVA